jgi:hypothetical protein
MLSQPGIGVAVAVGVAVEVAVGVFVGITVDSGVAVEVSMGDGVIHGFAIVAVLVGVFDKAMAVSVSAGTVAVGVFDKAMAVSVSAGTVAVGVFVEPLPTPPPPPPPPIGPPTGIELCPVDKLTSPKIVRALDDTISRPLIGMSFTRGV